MVCGLHYQDGAAEVLRLVSELRAEEEKHKRELEAVRQQCRMKVEETQRDGFSQCKI